MDRPGRKALLGPVAIISALAVFAVAGAQGPPAPLRAAKWLSAENPVVALSEQPSECFSAPVDPEDAWRAEVGRAVFRSPVLLGGQAAKAGVSCDTCHKNGRRNADLVFPGLSGEPGTADVTSSLVSSHRGDGIFNPKPIPDLAGPSENLMSRRLDTDQLSRFLNGIVTEEFDGEAPPPMVLRSLAIYVGQLNPQSCPPAATRTLSVTASADDVARAVKAAQGALAHGDTETALVVLEAGRAMLFLLDERYALPGLEAERSQIRTASLDLGSAQGAIRRKASAGPGLELWLDRYPVWRASLVKAERRSLYDRGVLAATMSGTASAPTTARAANAMAVSPSTGCDQPGTTSASGPITNNRSAALGCGTRTTPSSTTSRP